ncbi:MAG: Holliday junction resolvase RuvX [Candidatus Latescibacteria bacterium]|nr:Holliday junction resolvase RuvX [Candidatus Latescibacterota bacterium]
MGRILSLDYGRRRIGVAVSDPLHITAQGLETIVVDSYEEALEAVSDLVGQWDVGEIVVGLPLKSDGSKGEMAEEVEQFREDLVERVGVSVYLFDERMTSSAASRFLHEVGVKTGHRKEEVDRVAATLLLQDYLMIHRREDRAYGSEEKSDEE